MPNHKGKKRSRSRSRSRSRENHSSKRKSNEKFCELQKQIDNLTKVVQSLVSVQKEQTQPNPSRMESSVDIEIIGK